MDISEKKLKKVQVPDRVRQKGGEKRFSERQQMCIFCLVIWYPCNVSEMATVKVHATLGKQSGLH